MRTKNSEAIANLTTRFRADDPMVSFHGFVRFDGFQILVDCFINTECLEAAIFRFPPLVIVVVSMLETNLRLQNSPSKKFSLCFPNLNFFK